MRARCRWLALCALELGLLLVVRLGLARPARDTGDVRTIHLDTDTSSSTAGNRSTATASAGDGLTRAPLVLEPSQATSSAPFMRRRTTSIGTEELGEDPIAEDGAREAPLLEEPAHGTSLATSSMEVGALGFAGECDQVYMLAYDSTKFAMMGRFADAFVVGRSVDYMGRLRPYRRQGTWLSSLLLCVGRCEKSASGTNKIVTSNSLKASSLSVSAATAPTSASASYLTISVRHDDSSLMRYGNVELINADASKPDLLIDCSVENRPSSSVVYFKTATLDGSVRVVPPPQEWNVFSLQEHQKLTHLSVWIERLVTKFPNQLDGLIGATISHKHRLEDTKAFKASKLVGQDTLGLVPWPSLNVERGLNVDDLPEEQQ